MTSTVARPWTQTRFTSRGITLIECLACLAIIAVVVALFLPVLASSRFLSRQLSCGRRMSQSAATVFQYADASAELPPVMPRVKEGASLAQWGKPRARLRCDGIDWFEVDYFRQGRSWAMVATARLGDALTTETCPGVRLPDDRLDPLLWGHDGWVGVCGMKMVPSTYYIADSFLAQAAFWRSDSHQPLELARIQGLPMVVFPSQKAMLFETVLAHLGGEMIALSPECGIATPTAFADGHVRDVLLINTLPGVRNRFAPDGFTSLRQTEGGIQGIDVRY